MPANGLRYEHVAGFGELPYQTTPKLDKRLKLNNHANPAIAYERVLGAGFI